jgi:hypothetical protein
VAVEQKSRPYPGETRNGDAVVVRREESATLLAVVDGLGHGPNANLASSAAETHLRQVDLKAPVVDIMTSLHRALAGTRGAAATVVVLGGGRIAACAVGNVELRMYGASIPFRLTAGILGKQMKRLHVVDAQLERARIALYSDGVSSKFYLDDYTTKPLATTCEAIFATCARSTDDASLLLADIVP